MKYSIDEYKAKYGISSVTGLAARFGMSRQKLDHHIKKGGELKDGTPSFITVFVDENTHELILDTRIKLGEYVSDK